MFYHEAYTLAPKMVLPTRTFVLPISTACSKSPLMPMLQQAAREGMAGRASLLLRGGRHRAQTV